MCVCVCPLDNERLKLWTYNNASCYDDHGDDGDDDVWLDSFFPMSVNCKTHQLVTWYTHQPLFADMFVWSIYAGYCNRLRTQMLYMRVCVCFWALDGLYIVTNTHSYCFIAKMSCTALVCIVRSTIGWNESAEWKLPHWSHRKNTNWCGKVERFLYRENSQHHRRRYESH